MTTPIDIRPAVGPGSVAAVQGDQTGLMLGASTITTPNLFTAYTGYQAVDSTHNARLRFEVPIQVSLIRRVRFSFSLLPFRGGQQTTSTGAGAHRHQMMHLVSTGSESQVSHNDVATTMQNTAGAPYAVTFTLSGFAVPNDDFYTYDTANNHTHALAAPTGVYETSQSAQSSHLYLQVPGGSLNDITSVVTANPSNSSVPGPWGGGGSSDYTVDITPQFMLDGTYEVQLSSSTLGGVVSQIQITAQLNTGN